jgi:acetyl-CoA carboxylase biotin carboxylase subunit
MHRALLELTIEGVATSRDFHLRVMEDEEFRRGDIEIQWLERRLDSLMRTPPPARGVMIAAVAAALLAERDRTMPSASAGDVAMTAAAAEPARAPDDAWVWTARREGLRSR